MSRTLIALGVALALLVTGKVNAQSHFADCATLTGNNATILIPSTASITLDGSPLATNSEVAVFNADGLCAGVVVWRGEATGVAIWGDDTQTEAKDGLAADERFTYRLWDASAQIEYSGTASATFSDAQPFYTSDQAYVENGIYELTSFSMETGPVGNENPNVPRAFKLHANYPNPFNPSTTIRYDLPEAAEVRIAVYNAAGALVDVLVSESMPAGSHTLQWEAANLPSGTYFCRVQMRSESRIQPMILLK